MITTHDIDTIRGGTAYDRSGSKLGKVGDVYLDNSSGDPAWVTVHTGLFGTRQSFVPLQGASLDGGNLRLPHDKATVKDAPNIGDDEALRPDAEQALYRHYGIDPRGSGQQDRGTDSTNGTRGADDTGRRRDEDRPREEKRLADERAERDGRDDRGLTEQAREHGGRDERDRSEDHDQGSRTGAAAGAAAGTAAEAAGRRHDRDDRAGSHESVTDRATEDHRGDEGSTDRRDSTPAAGNPSDDAPGPRLRKHVVTEMQTITVPVEREVYTLEDGTPVDEAGSATGDAGRHQDGDRR